MATWNETELNEFEPRLKFFKFGLWTIAKRGEVKNILLNIAAKQCKLWKN